MKIRFKKLVTVLKGEDYSAPESLILYKKTPWRFESKTYHSRNTHVQITCVQTRNQLKIDLWFIIIQYEWFWPRLGGGWSFNDMPEVENAVTATSSSPVDKPPLTSPCKVVE